MTRSSEMDAAESGELASVMRVEDLTKGLTVQLSP
jgi:hypothetical protein